MEDQSKPFNAFDNLAKQRQIYNLQLIIAIQTELAASDLDLNKFMDNITEQMLYLTPSIGAVIELVEGEEMVYRAASGALASHIGTRLSQHNSLSGLAVKECKTLVANDTETDSRVNLAACRQIGARSLAAAPLLSQSKAIGVLKIMSDRANAFQTADIEMLQLISGFVGSALAQQISHRITEEALRDKSIAYEKLKEAEKNLEYLATHDHLTKLVNRQYFTCELEVAFHAAMNSDNKIALMYIDVDYFKQINDTHGHDIGDKVLKTFVKRVQNCVRESDLFARIGGDEFVILLRSITPNEAADIATEIQNKLRKPFKFDGLSLMVTSSIGIAMLDDSMKSPDDLIKKADEHLYCAKKAGRACYKIKSS